jgi:competence protein ComEC
MVLMAPEPAAEGTVNDRSLVPVTHGDASFLLTGDIEAGGEDAILRSPYPLQSTVLKVAHHGSAPSTPVIRAVDPVSSVISAGRAIPSPSQP